MADAHNLAARGLPRGAIDITALTKLYDTSPTRVRARSAVPWLDQRFLEPHAALDSVQLQIEPGEAIGVIGPNGAGKSTLLKIIAGIAAPTSGSVHAAGRIGAMIELGSGFHPDLTGRENLRVNAALLGLNAAELAAREAQIADFSGLGEALDQPVATYSSGMQARLGFSVASSVDADILLIDEALAVGDEEFYTRCLDRVAEHRAAGATIVVVSHQMQVIRHLCDRAILLRAGRIVQDGPAAEVVRSYTSVGASTYDRPVERSARFSNFAVDDTLTPWEPLRFNCDLVVERPLRQARCVVELTLPTFAPGHVFCSSEDPIADELAPGTYRLEGVSRPFPGESGLLGVAVTLLDGMGQEALDVAHAEVTVEGPAHIPKPRLAVTPKWEITSSTDLLPDASGAEGVERGGETRATGDAAIVTTGLMKRFRRARTTMSPTRDHPALEGLNLKVPRGSIFGIIGTNGAGKSTLLRVLAGITRPDSGTFRVTGRTVPLLEMGLGFDPRLTGRENVTVSAALLGLSRHELCGSMAEIEELARLGEAFDHEVRTYSSGMQARLSLALALVSRPDVLLIDEVLSVGDHNFRERAIEHLLTLRAGGTTAVLVSHDLELIGAVCDEVARMGQGRVVDQGDPLGVIERYGGATGAGGSHHADPRALVTDVRADRRHVLAGDSLDVSGAIEVREPLPDARVEVSLRSRPDDPTELVEREDLHNWTFLRADVEPAGGILAHPGLHHFRLVIDRNEFEGEIDVAVAVLVHDQLVSESWVAAQVGGGGAVRPVLDVEWAASPLAQGLGKRG